MNALMVLDEKVRLDDSGRYSLNDLHKAAIAAGVTKDIRPSEWLALSHTQEMVEILIQENPAIKPVESKAGRYGGTFVVRQMVYGYAMWISARFHLQVIAAFDALARGDIEEAKRLASRNQARLEAPHLTDAIRHRRQAQGKAIAHYHFSNEFDLINRVALGKSAKEFRAAHNMRADDPIRDSLTKLEIACVESLQRANTTMIDMGLPFDRRKTELHKIYITRHAAGLLNEVKRIEG